MPVILRNLLEGAQFVQDHVIHFYHLHALDWVDIVSALSADPAATSELARSISDWPNSSPGLLSGVRDRLQTFVDSGQLGLFANAYWGHPAYKLPPEANLLAVAHYLEALDWQREIIKMHAILGGKNPHPQTYLVGGMAIPVTPNGNHGDQSRADRPVENIWPPRLWNLCKRSIFPTCCWWHPTIRNGPDWGREWATIWPMATFPATLAAIRPPSGCRRASSWARTSTDRQQALDHNQIREYVTHSWYNYAEGDGVAKHPWDGETEWNYTGPQPPFDHLNTDGKYSWLKAPRYNSQPMEVGPLARMAVAYAAGHSRVRELVRLGAGPAGRWT